MSEPKKILVTGAAGRIGQAVVAELQSCNHDLRGFDLRAMSAVADFVVGDLANENDVRRAMAGVDVVIHLAATPDDADFKSELLPNNLLGLYHIMEAAREAGVRRMMLASSGQVVWGQRTTGPWPIPVDTMPTPRYWYAATKMFMEAIGHSYSVKHDMEIVVVRVGWCPRTKEQVQEIAEQEWAQDVYFSPGDAGRFFECTVKAELPDRYCIVYATSKPVHHARLDLEPAKRLFGYEPQERWPQGIELIVGENISDYA